MKKIFKFVAYGTILEIGVIPVFTEFSYDKNDFTEEFKNTLIKNIEKSFNGMTVLHIDFKITCFTEKTAQVVVHEILPHLLFEANSSLFDIESKPQTIQKEHMDKSNSITVSLPKNNVAFFN
jgi:hypothetical protein